MQWRPSSGISKNQTKFVKQKSIFQAICWKPEPYMRKKEDSESESLLINKDNVPGGSYTEEGGNDAPLDLREMDYVDTDVSVLSQFHEDALQQAGVGLFQYFLFIVLGVGLAADAVEIFVIAYVLPSAERELCMDEPKKGWLAAISFLGMMVGGLVWGTLGDRLGRRRTLVSALTTNAIFAVTTAFMPSYGLFMVMRFMSGVGVGGSLPIVFTYYSEFLVKRHRGRHLSWLLTFWGIGGLYTALMAWVMITEPELGRGSHLSSWRIFMVVCAAPALLTVFGLFFLPESPRYLLECGRDVEAMYVYQKVFRINHKQSDEYQLSEMELPSRRSPSAGLSGPGGCINDFMEAFESFWGSFMQIMMPPYRLITFLLLVIWVTTAFGFYGISIWFPEYMRAIREEEYAGQAKSVKNHTFKKVSFTNVLENTRFEKVRFIETRFDEVLINHCIFTDCKFRNSTFDHVQSSRTFFLNSNFTDVMFETTDLNEEHFSNCRFRNSPIPEIDGCPIDFDANLNLTDVFVEAIIAQAAIIPGNILSSFAMDRFGRVKTMVASLFIASLSTFSIWFLNTRISVLVFEAIFNFISISGWNAVDVITTESYPTSLRSTGYGFLSAVSRIAAILGNLTFGYLIHITRTVPIMTVSLAFLIASIFSLRMPETRDILM